MLLFYEIKFSKLKCFIDVAAKYFINIETNIVGKKYISLVPIFSSLRIWSTWLPRLEKSVVLNLKKIAFE